MNPSNDQQHWNSSLIIRSFQHSDQVECHKILRDGSEEILKHISFVFLSTVSWYVVLATVLSSIAAILWSIWIFAAYGVIIFVVLVYPYIKWHFQFKRWRNRMLKTEFRDINGCHNMWVAEWNAKVVGMVRLTYNEESHNLKVARLENMFVLPSFRGMRISEKMLNELIAHAKRQRVKKIVLFTSSAQTPAIRLYKKHGFRVMSVQKMIPTITHLDFALQL